MNTKPRATTIEMKIDLKKLILILSLLSLSITLSNSLFASFRVQKESLIHNTLESNYAYATKIAFSVRDLMSSASTQLLYSSRILSQDFKNKKLLDDEAKRIRNQSNIFNSVFIANNEGVVLATDPDLGIKGQTLSSAGSEIALREKKPFISDPFIAQTGRLLITVSQPIFDNEEVYLGYISGTIYLNDPSILNHMLNKHFHIDGSYIYVVDDERRIIFHPDKKRIGDQVNGNPVIDDISNKNSGLKQIVNSEGIEMLAGYHYVPEVGWGIVTQRPLSSTLEPMNELIYRVMLNALPMTILLILFIVQCARIISKPLRRLAEGASTMDIGQIKTTKAWYFETMALQKALISGISFMQGKIDKLNSDVAKDALTGLANRRVYEICINTWESYHRSVAIIAIDIDHFKKVNDTYGHAVGDEVLKKLSEIMSSCARAADVVCRIGGEEFLILAPAMSRDSAKEMAERIRVQVSEYDFNTVGNITISLGVAVWPYDCSKLSQLSKMADDMLYQAKANGRNRVETADELE
ncbi:sensor domain-containing diguanylate cyclase [Bordetella avium]|uniref:sensor domain-containing diguanylate cyclase n=2 Tax=Bordetella avium TaxID=521 RepID=UPI000E0C8A8E|nr:sensor domain-containing diguanylate cyclase [Bordetella avium]RIQ13985.1 diguanylate cyclase [Bordetella avium]RIQ57062.1 diguanylate cyclase [Bordetella avium]RIQ66113.1 diguanylate cyclase [Bordetella avium]RIQ66795.1 diguanylate cyclase [Bordetella avium]RIQ80134.1 diguanylate cyclase [Bordetella avium]